MPTSIDHLLAYERYLPVLSPSEVEALGERRPTLGTLQEWEGRLKDNRARLEAIFDRAYKRLKKNGK